MLASAMARARRRLWTIPGHVQGLHHHSARRLGYRRGGLVMSVVPDIDSASMELPARGVKALPVVGMIAPAVDLPAAGLSPYPSAAAASGWWLAPSGCPPGPHRNRWPSLLLPHPPRDGGSPLQRRRRLTVLDAQAGEPHPRCPVDSHFPDGTCKPQLLHHSHRPYPGQDDHLGPLSARKPCSCFLCLYRGNPTRRTEPWPLFIRRRYSPQPSAAWPKSMMAYLAAFWDNTPPQGAGRCPSPGSNEVSGCGQ